MIAAIRTAKQFLTFVNGAPFQPAIAVGLRLGDSYFQEFVATLRTKRNLLGNMLIEAGFQVFEPEGTYFTTVDVAHFGYDDGIEFCLSLPERAGVVAVPSQVFYQHRTAGATLVRFCFAKKDEVLMEAGQRLVAAFGS